MATFKYPYTVKANGKIVPPNTEVEIDSETTKAVINTPQKRTTKKKV